MASVSATPRSSIAAGTSSSARCVVTSATRSGASAAPPTSIITTRGVAVRSAKNSVWPMNAMPASMHHALLHRRRDERGERAGGAGVAVACCELRERAARVGGIGRAGRRPARERVMPHFDDAGGRAQRPGCSRHSAAELPMRAARSASSARSPTNTSRAGKRARQHDARRASRKLGADARGLAAVTASMGCCQHRLRRSRRRPAASPNTSTFTPGATARRSVRSSAGSMSTCANPSSGARACRTPTGARAGRGVDLARVLHGAAERQRVAFAAEHRKLLELRAIAQHLPPGEALARVEVVPRAGRQRDLDFAAGLHDRRDEQRVAAHELRLVVADKRIARERERHRAHDRQAGCASPARSRARDRESAGSGTRATSSRSPRPRRRTPTARARRCRGRECASRTPSPAASGRTAPRDGCAAP